MHVVRRRRGAPAGAGGPSPVSRSDVELISSASQSVRTRLSVSAGPALLGLPALGGGSRGRAKSGRAEAGSDATRPLGGGRGRDRTMWGGREGRTRGPASPGGRPGWQGANGCVGRACGGSAGARDDAWTAGARATRRFKSSTGKTRWPRWGASGRGRRPCRARTSWIISRTTSRLRRTRRASARRARSRATRPLPLALGRARCPRRRSAAVREGERRTPRQSPRGPARARA